MSRLSIAGLKDIDTSNVNNAKALEVLKSANNRTVEHEEVQPANIESKDSAKTE
jgi:hypothetical protein